MSMYEPVKPGDPLYKHPVPNPSAPIPAFGYTNAPTALVHRIAEFEEVVRTAGNAWEEVGGEGAISHPQFEAALAAARAGYIIASRALILWNTFRADTQVNNRAIDWMTVFYLQQLLEASGMVGEISFSLDEQYELKQIIAHLSDGNYSALSADTRLPILPWPSPRAD